MNDDTTTIPGYRLGVAIGWLMLIAMLLLMFTDIDSRIAYVAEENGWAFIAWLFSGSYPQL